MTVFLDYFATNVECIMVHDVGSMGIRKTTSFFHVEPHMN